MGKVRKYSANGKKKRASSKAYNKFQRTVREVMPYIFDWQADPIYLRAYKYDVMSEDYDYCVSQCGCVRYNDSSRITFDSATNNMYALINNNDENVEIKDIWRFLDSSLQRDKDLHISETRSLMDILLDMAQKSETKAILDIKEEIYKICHDPNYYPDNKKEMLDELHEQEVKLGGKEALFTNAFLSYRPRDVSHSIEYVPHVLVKRFYNAIYPVLKPSEKKLVDWVEENIPGTTHKFLAAILNQKSFISINYFLPPLTIITSGEQQKLFRYRRMILQKVGVVSKTIGTPQQSSLLSYTDMALDFIDSILPGYKDSGIKPVLDKIKELKENIDTGVSEINSITNAIIEMQSLLEIYKNNNEKTKYELGKKMLEKFKNKESSISSSRGQLLASFDELNLMKDERLRLFLNLSHQFNT